MLLLAVDSCNMFHYLTYEGSVDFDIIDERMRKAFMSQINEFGQTPSQIFKSEHPPR